MRTQLESTAKAMVKRLSVLLIALCLCCVYSTAQTRTVKGTVVDDTDEPLPGVSVIIKGHKTGVATDIEGNYTIKVQPGDVLNFTYVGMKPHSVKVGQKNDIDVKLMPDANSLDEFVAVGYGVQKRGTITGAISTVKGPELLKAPTMSVSNLISGRVAGVASVQSSGEPGNDNAAINVRAQDHIVYVIDGVKRTSEDFNQIDPNDIESISVLKDAASVAIYGLDANGVIIVTTKRGKTEKTTISYTGTVGISQNAENQEWLDGPGYAYWFNKGLEMDGRQPIFTQQHVENMVKGIKGWGNTNWYKEVFGTGFRTSHNVSATGGNEKVNFFASVGYLKEDGNVDKFTFDRWTLRSNVDAKIANGLKFSMGVSARIQNTDNPYFSANPNAYGNIGSQMVRQLPYLPKTYTDKNGTEMYVGNISNGMNMSTLASIYNNGYTRKNTNNIQTTMTLQWDTPFLPGLSAKFTAAYDANFYFSKQLNNPAEIWLYSHGAAEFVAPDELTYMHYRNFNNNYIALTEGSNKNSSFTTITSLNYNNQFGKHTVTAIALLETRENKANSIGAYGRGLNFVSLDELDKVSNQRFDGSEFPPSISGTSSMARVAGLAARANYNYADRYFVEASLRRDGSYLFRGMDQQWVLLPGFSLGWRIDREDFFNADWVQNLKIRASYGKTSTSDIAPFYWRNNWGMNENGVVIGGNSSSFASVGIIGNPFVTWSRCDNWDIGVDANLWNGLLTAELDMFYKYEHDKLTYTTGAYPPSMGGYFSSAANINKLDIKGFDVTLTHNNRIGDFNYGAKLIWSYAYKRWLYYAGDSDNAPDYQRLTGKQCGAKYGFIANGLFQTQEDIDNEPKHENSPNGVLLGDIRYIDRNGDGRITYAEDMGWVGKSHIPTHFGSLDLHANWKGFDLDVLFVWGLGHDVALTGQYTAEGSVDVMDHTSYTLPFKWFGNSPVYLVENSWTPEHTNAEFPRLCATPQNNNNAYASTFWYKNGDYLRMKTFQIGYSLPAKIIRKAGMSKLRFFVEGFNLFTLSGLSKYNIDPESPAVNNGYYPQQRKISFGVNVGF